MIVIDSGAVQIKMLPWVSGLPKGICVEYFGKVHDGRLFVILRPKEDWDYGDFVCLMGQADALRNVPIKDVRRYRDGGTTEVATAEGKFYFPTPFEPTRKPTFDGRDLELYEVA